MLKGIDRYIPVTFIFPVVLLDPKRCFTRLWTLQRKIDDQKLSGPEKRPRHHGHECAEEFPVPAFGEHDLEPAAKERFNLWNPN